MTKVTIGIFLSILLFSTEIISTEESTDHQKNISKAVKMQLLRMKLKKTAKTKIASRVNGKLKPVAKKNIEQSKMTQQENKSSTLAVINQKKIEKKLEIKPPLVSSQQKNDDLRMKLQDLVKSISND